MYNEAIQQCKDYLAKSSEEHIATSIALSQKFKYANGEPANVNIESITNSENTLREEAKALVSLPLEEYYSKYRFTICDITGKVIPYDTDYYIQVIRDDKHDPDYRVYSLEGLKIMAEQINSLT